MKPLKLIVSLAAAVCAVCTAHAQTNIVTISATMTIQQPQVDGVNVATIASKSSVLTTSGLIAELSSAIHTNFSKAAKLAVISGNGNTNSQFEVIDGTTNVAISTNIITIFPTTGHQVISGKETSNTLTEKMLMVFELDFNDVGLGASDLQFSLRGIGTISMMETQTSGSTSAKMTLVGDGTLGSGTTTNFVATATLSGTAKQ